MLRRKLLAGIASFGLLCFGTAGAMAQPAWPSQTIRLLVPYAPGGNADLLGRLIGPKLSEALGQPVVVDNKAGAGGAIGAAEAARAAPDGHTLLMGDIATHAINPAVNDKLAYKPLEQFTPVVRLTSVSLLLVVNPKLEAKSVADLIALAKAQPGTLDYASAGNGTPQHLAFEYLKSKTGIEAAHVPYKGSAPAITDLVGGHVSAMIDGTAVPYVKDGALRALAVTGAKRSPVLPDVPTLSEAGVPGYEFASWHGLFVPAGTPSEIVARLNAEVNRTLTDPAVRQRMADLNIDLVGGTSEDFAAFVQTEARKMQDLAKLAGARVE
jgi:tripartite-type tricarboxylate transporter receptor subunit TctC